MPKKESTDPRSEKERNSQIKKTDKKDSGEKGNKKQETRNKRQETPKKTDQDQPRREIPVTQAEDRGLKSRLKPQKGSERVVNVSHEDMVVLANAIVTLRSIADNDTKTKYTVTGSTIDSGKRFLASANYSKTYIDGLSTEGMFDLIEDTLEGKTSRAINVEPPPADKNERNRIYERVYGYTNGAEKVAAAEIEESQKPARESDDLTVERIRARIIVEEEAAEKFNVAISESGYKAAGVEAPRRGGIVTSKTPLFAMDSATLARTLAEQNSTFKIPDEWDKWNPMKRALELFNHRPRITGSERFPIIAGGATKYQTGNDTADHHEAFRRLDELDDDEINNAAQFTGQNYQADRMELVERLVQLFEHHDPNDPRLQERMKYELLDLRVNIAFRELKTLKSLARTNTPLPQNLTGLEQALTDFLLETKYPVATKVMDRMYNLVLKGANRTLVENDELDSLRDLLPQMLTKAEQWSQWQQALDAGIADDFNTYQHFGNQNIRDGYKLVFDLATAISRVENTARGTGQANVNLLNNEIISLAERDKARLMYRKMNKRFEKLVGPLPIAVQNDIFKELYAEVDALDREAQLYGYAPDVYSILLMDRISRLNLRGGYEGVLEWKGTVMAEGYNLKFHDRLRGLPPKDWRDSYNYALGLFTHVESEDLPVQALQEALQNAAAIAKDLALGKHPAEQAEADKLRLKIDRLYRAVFAKVQERETLQSTSWDPEKVFQVYASPNWTDDTHQVFYERFDEDPDGENFVDAQGNKFNLLDKAMQIYFKHYAEERRKLNMAEALTLIGNINQNNLDPNNNSEIKALFKRNHFTQQEVDMFNRVRKELLIVAANKAGVLPNGLPSTVVPVNNVNRTVYFHEMNDAQIDAAFAALTANQLQGAADFWAADLGNMRGAITEWMTHRTWVGATNETKVMWTDPVTNQEKPKSLLEFRKIQANLELEAVLQGLGISQDKMERYQRALLLRQAANVAYWETYALGAQASYGIVRIYDRNKDWYKNDFGTVKQVREVAYTDESNFYIARIVDNVFEYYVDESRGRHGKDVEGGRLMEVNAIFQKFMLGKRHGMLPQNRLLVKVARDNFSAGPTAIEEFGNKLIVQGPHAGNYGGALDHAVHHLDNGENLGLHPGHISPQDVKYAKGVALADMIDDGTISFENIEWSKSFKRSDTNLKKWLMQDMWADRMGIKKFYDKFQEYLKAPNSKALIEMMNTVFYSKRGVIVNPYMKMILPAHFEVGKYWKELYQLPANMSSSEREDVLEECVRKDMISKQEGHHMIYKASQLSIGVGKAKINIPGFLMARRIGQWLELTGRVAKEAGKRSWVIPLFFIWYLLFGSFNQIKDEFKAK